MKGWVYVITNKGMPGLLKVGFTTRDPELRADELSHTGAAYPYLVDYVMLVEYPYEVEQKAHKLLVSHHEGKEWFRCSLEEAVAAIKQASEDRVIVEFYKGVERSKVDALYLGGKEKSETCNFDELFSGKKISKSKNWYREALVVIGAVGRRQTIQNKLNSIANLADDVTLRSLAKKAIDVLERTSTNPSHTPLKKMACMRNIPLERYCNECLSASGEQI